MSVITACGLRLLEGVDLQVSQIDSARMHLLMRGGNGHKDRAVPLPARTRSRLRAHWPRHRNPIWRLPTTPPAGQRYATAAMDERGLQKAFRKALSAGGVTKPATIHALRHSWATHPLENGVRVRVVQRWLGHTSPTTTAISTHLTQPIEQRAAKALDELTAGLP